MKKVKMKVRLTTLGPIQCSGSGRHSWGIDSVFVQSFDGRYFIPKDHVKGRLAYAWREIRSVMPSFLPQYNNLIGQNSDGNYDPNRGSLFISDFFLQDPLSVNENNINRIMVNDESGMADEGALLRIATPFKRGQVVQWIGTFEFVAADEKMAHELQTEILQGLRWNAGVGAFKSIGFGRVFAAENLSSPEDVKEIRVDLKPAGSANRIFLAIHAKEPLLLGGIKIKENYIKSEEIISGSVLKGSMASAVNWHLGKDLNKPLDAKSQLPLLSKYFDDLIFSHALPTHDRNPVYQPFVPPLSVVNKDDILQDVAAIEDQTEAISRLDKVVDFSIDMKDAGLLNEAFVLASPARLSFTRTQIEDSSQRAEEEKLYTYEYVCPVDEQGNSLVWLATIDLPAFTKKDENEKHLLLQELEFVIQNWWYRLGKRGSQVCIKVSDEPCRRYQQQPISNNAVIVVLQSDSLMLDPDEYSRKTDLLEVYDQFWKNISRNIFSLRRFFSNQKLFGGYLVKRFSSNKDHYEPYLLTCAGSVFVLGFDPEKKDDAGDFLEHWQTSGLPLPEWTRRRYGNGADLSWKNCPFLPQNGYGHICVNLDWHWNHILTPQEVS